MLKTIAIFVIALVLGGCAASQNPRPTPLPNAQPTGPTLAGLRAQQNLLLGGGQQAFNAEIGRLRGYPVVINKWASWCPPCRAEFALFQRQSQARGAQIAFMGLDSMDNAADARGFLRQFSVGYPSFSDPDGSIAASLGGAAAFPTTIFLDRTGRVYYLKQGAYADEQSLARDLDRYAR